MQGGGGGGGGGDGVSAPITATPSERGGAAAPSFPSLSAVAQEIYGRPWRTGVEEGGGGADERGEDLRARRRLRRLVRRTALSQLETRRAVTSLDADAHVTTAQSLLQKVKRDVDEWSHCSLQRVIEFIHECLCECQKAELRCPIEISACMLTCLSLICKVTPHISLMQGPAQRRQPAWRRQ
jgi:hypothetical protein